MIDESCPQSFLEHRTAIDITLRGTIEEDEHYYTLYQLSLSNPSDSDK